MDAAAKRLMDLALEIAGDQFDENVDKVVAACGTDVAALVRATDALARQAKSAGSTEHIAFTYLAAAHRRLTNP